MKQLDPALKIRWPERPACYLVSIGCKSLQVMKDDASDGVCTCPEDGNGDLPKAGTCADANDPRTW